MTTSREPHGGALRAALDDLVVRGAEVWDAPAVSLVRTLLRKAEGLEGAGRAQLLNRAAVRFEMLAQSFGRARERADQTYAELARLGLDPDKRLDSALHYGRFDEVARAAKRHDQTRRVAREAIVTPWLERLSHEAQVRGISQPPPPLEGGGVEPALPERETVTGLAAAIYQDAAADATARLVVAQATSELPAHAGRYHAASVAARTLQALSELAPAYLRVQVARLEAISTLQRWVADPPPAKAARSKTGAKPAASATPKGRKSRSKPPETPSMDALAPDRIEAAE